MSINLSASPSAIGQGFSQKVLRYFLTFLQTDFKKQQAPRRRIQIKSDAGFRMGMPVCLAIRGSLEICNGRSGRWFDYEDRPTSIHGAD